VDYNVIIVLTLEIVANKQTENVVIGQFLQVLRELHLRFGQVEEQVLDKHAVTTVRTQQVDQEVTML
tara:strand:- start:281 stop:481 length:201 start_codon:yes stop_codon:yes gene_type:complete